MKEKLLLLFAITITQFGFGQIGFEENAITNYINAPNDVHSVDIDNDGDMDLLAFSPSLVVWFENADGQGSFTAHKIISTLANNVKSVYAADIDGDGDMDVLSASANDDKIAWYENTDGQGSFSAQQIITTLAADAQSVFAVDLDGDGDEDVLSASDSDNKIAWYENTDGQGTFGVQQIISISANRATSVYASDLDGDGDMDVVSGSLSHKKIAWYENTDGQGTFGTEQIITTGAIFISQLYVLDVDGDGDMDIMSDYSQSIVWFENTDGQGTFVGPQIIGYTFSASSGKFYPTDFDSDGDIDVLSVSPLDPNKKIIWFEHTDGQGTFADDQVVSTLEISPNYVHATDLDGDGDSEVIFSSYWGDRIAWYENTDGQGTVGAQQAVSPLTRSPGSVYSSDLDGDGDMDVLSTSFPDKIAWYENTDGQGTFKDQKIISNGDGGGSIHAADLDGDGDKDVLSASSGVNKIIWYENTDGQGTFGTQQGITTSADGVISIFVSDLDDDGDMDVLSASVNDDKIAWYENTDGQGTFGLQQIITTNADYPTDVYAVDIDGDGDMDVLSASYFDNKIAWYENTDGQGSFGPQQIITTSVNEPRSVYASDLDNDGDMDVLSASVNDNKIAWYENTDGQGTFGAQQTITTMANGARSVYASDLDNDGDIDVLSSSRNNDTVAWYENTDGQGTFGVQQVITTSADGATSIFASDLNGDGAMDVLSTSVFDDKIAWFKNLGTIANEINGEITIDMNSNGCDDTDLPIGNLLIETTDGAFSLSTFSLNNGIYQLFPGSGDFTTSVVTPLPDYYTVTPASATSNFTGVGNTDTVDFCLQTTGTYNDVNITVYPNIDDPRPGFNTSYQIVYNNIGTTQLSGDIAFEFNDSKMQFLNASQIVASQTSNTLTFNYADLNPFETRTIDLVFNVFPPPTTNIDDILSSSATINPIPGDETPNDNVFNLRQIVIGSYDPNDIRVLEGDEILIEDIDKYLHYIIRFQNTGTASAINVRVQHILDNKLDWTTLQLQTMSHAGRVEITDGNNIKFIFDDINLADSTNDEPNSHGHIAFKIKPKSNVVIGDIINGVADIFFDFNPPITTNIASTEIVDRLSVVEFGENTIAMFPNPAKDKLIIQAKFPIHQITVLDINGKLLKSPVLSNSKKEFELNVSDLSQGMYFVKIQTEFGIQTQKIIKK